MQVKECFIMDVDRDAYILAAQSNAVAMQNFFLSRMVFSEGSRVRCRQASGKQVGLKDRADVKGLEGNSHVWKESTARNEGRTEPVHAIKVHM